MECIVVKVQRVTDLESDIRDVISVSFKYGGIVLPGETSFSLSKITSTF